MSCRELERLFVAGAPESEQRAHRGGCPECARLGADLDSTAALATGLQRPGVEPAAAPGAAARSRRMTVTCEGAEMLLAGALEGELADERRGPPRSPTSRAAPDAPQAAGALFAMRDLAAPEPPPWLATRLVAAKPAKKKSFWRAGVLRKARHRVRVRRRRARDAARTEPDGRRRKDGLREPRREHAQRRHGRARARSATGSARSRRKPLRTLAVWKGHVGGYGRAAVSNAIAIVWKPESKKTPSRPRLGKDGGAASQSGELQTGGSRDPGTFAPAFSCVRATTEVDEEKNDERQLHFTVRGTAAPAGSGHGCRRRRPWSCRPWSWIASRRDWQDSCPCSRASGICTWASTRARSRSAAPSRSGSC